MEQWSNLFLCSFHLPAQRKLLFFKRRCKHGNFTIMHIGYRSSETERTPVACSPYSVLPRGNLCGQQMLTSEWWEDSKARIYSDRKTDKCCPSGSIEHPPLRTWTRSPEDMIPAHKFWSLPHLWEKRHADLFPWIWWSTVQPEHS